MRGCARRLRNNPFDLKRSSTGKDSDLKRAKRLRMESMLSSALDVVSEVKSSARAVELAPGASTLQASLGGRSGGRLPGGESETSPFKHKSNKTT